MGDAHTTAKRLQALRLDRCERIELFRLAGAALIFGGILLAAQH